MIGTRTLALMIASSLTLSICGCHRAKNELGDESAQEQRSDAILQPDDDAKTVIEKATKVVGDEAALAQWKCGIVKYKTKGNIVPGESGESLTEDTFQLPGHFKRVMRVEGGGKNLSIRFVSNHGKWWTKKGDAPAEPMDNDFSERTEHPFAEYSRLPMIGGNDFQRIEPSGERIDGKEVIGIRVRHADLNSFDCYFARQTGLLLEFTNTVPGTNPDKASTLNSYLSDYKKVRGCMVPMRIERIREGKTMVDVTILDLEFAPKFDESLFVKP